MRILTASQLRAGHVIWRTSAACHATIVCKLSYRLQPGTCGFADDPQAIIEADGYRQDEKGQSSFVPGDLVPYKPRADLLVSSAGKARPAQPGAFARVTFGTFDKTCEPSELAPIAPDWPARRSLLRQHASGWSHNWSAQPLPDDIDYGFFNAAPHDQQLDPFNGDEHLLLENLHPVHERLASRLPGFRPRAYVEPEDGPPYDLVMACDTVVIEPDRSLITLTWRGRIELADPQASVSVLIAVESGAQLLDYAMVSRRVVAGDEGTRQVKAGAVEEKALPFSGAVPPAHRSSPGTDSPEETHLAVSKASATLTEGMPAWLRAPAGAPPSSGAGSSRGETIPAVAPPPPAPPLPPPPAPPLPAPPPPPAAAPPPVMMAPVVVDAPASPWSGHGHAAAANDARFWSSAPDPLRAAAPMAVSPPQPQPVSATAPVVTARSARPSEVVELLWYDPAAIASIREAPSFKTAILSGRPPILELGYDQDVPPEEPVEVKERRDVMSVMHYANATYDEGLKDEIADAVSDDGTFSPPLVMVIGELLLPFDEIETLKAAVALAKPVSSGDPKLKEALDAADELLATGLALSQAAEKLSSRIREAFAQTPGRALPANYLDKELERVLLTERRYQHRTVLGRKSLRGLVGFSSTPGTAWTLPAYLPEEIALELPMYASFRVRIIAEAHLQQDQYESHAAALRVVALGRVAKLPPLGRGKT
jgi:hypothetical protein